MTKEEVLDREYTIQKDGNTALMKIRFPGEYREVALSAMDEYAKQQAIALAKFINSRLELHGDNYTYVLGDGEVYSPEEIYNHFIEHQNK